VSKGKRIIIPVILAMLVVGIWLGENIRACPMNDMNPAKQLFALRSWFNPNVVRKVHTKEKLVALTFDDGPDPRYTSQVLDILKQYQVRATFFVVGEYVKAHPELVRKEVVEGHEVENHSYTHPDLETDDEIEVIRELEATQEVLRKTTGSSPRYLRPPRGLFNNEVVETAECLGMKTVLWDVGVEHHSCSTPEQMAGRVIEKAHPGIIILAHDGRLDRTLTLEALPIVIEGYQKMGYRFVTVTELLKNATGDGSVVTQPPSLRLNKKTG